MRGDSQFLQFDKAASDADQHSEEIEILGPHLRVSGRVVMGRFKRISDLVNHSQGYVVLHGAKLLRRNGDPTNLELAEVLVNQDEITFLGQRTTGEPATASAPAEPLDGFAAYERPALAKQTRRFVIFTPGHTITGDVHVYPETTLGSFVESPDPRFVAMTNVRARSLADRRVISHFDLLLVNKTQITAAAEAGNAAAVAD